MTNTLIVRDETATGKTVHEFELELPTERMTVRELIRSRVYQEVKDHNTQPLAKFEGLVTPTDDEAALNGNQPKQRSDQIDWRRQFDRVLTAFRARQILLLVDDKQVDSLDEEVELAHGTQLTFLRLTLLTGG